ncbi:hypothetical protein PUN28_014965 [Cardiocondyla obscurior]|uniref:Uncharacterized protein n=1 Tax=Cardiocondyla obscurior TaxID=286306 RepID=A0AAW2F056_9HYME
MDRRKIFHPNCTAIRSLCVSLDNEQPQDIASRPVRSKHCMYTRVVWRSSEWGERGVGAAFLKRKSSITDYAPCTTQRTELLLFSQKY